MAELQNNITNKIYQPIAGLNTDFLTSQVKQGQLTYALNATINNFDGNQVNYQNEEANRFCSDIKSHQGYIVIGRYNFVEQNRTIYFLVNPETGDSEIGQKLNNGCEYQTIINAKCLNFNINYPIHKIVPKTTNCSTQLYWTDSFNTLRWIDLDDLPYVETPDPNKEGSFIKDTTKVDCNKLQVQPDFSIPQIKPDSLEVGGSLRMGSYQFAIQYSNSRGEAYTSMYSITNPLGIFDDKVTQSFDLPTTKAISVDITDIDTSGLYDYFNLVVLKTVNNITTPYIAGTFPILESTFHTVYTGNNEESEIRLSMNDVFDRFPYYDIAGDVTSSDNVLIWSNLKVQEEINYQNIWSNVKLNWETWQVPVNKFEGYNNPINTGELRGYMRDDVYAFEGCFILKNGKILKGFHIPGPDATSYDLEIVNNKDASNIKNDPCDEVVPRKRWEVYNTASVIDYTDEYKNNEDDSCYKGSYQYGNFGYWESSERYPNNTLIWGNLANKPIRHHKFPDCLVSPIHSNNPSADPIDQYFIYPIGVRVDMNSLYDAIDKSNLTQEQKDQIVGFKILRGNRATNKSIIAKGLLYNVGKYNIDNQTFYYPNYPYNDLRRDPFISDSKVLWNSGDNSDKRLNGFGDDVSRYRYTFHSPDTHFYQPFGIDSGYLKLETVEYGQSKGHFVEVANNARYQFMSRKALMAAFGVALSSIVSLDSGGGFLGVAPSATLMPGNVPPSFVAMLDIIKGIIPFINYGWQYNSIGNYGASYPVPNDGNKIRQIDSGSYIISGMQTVDGERINNFRRESSVYLKTGDSFLYPHEVDESIPEDQSRFTLTSGQAVPSDFNFSQYQNQAGLYWDSLSPQDRMTSFFYGDLSSTSQIMQDTQPWNESWINIVSGYPTQDLSVMIIDRVERIYVNSVLGLTTDSLTSTCQNPGSITIRNISSYYGAIKRDFPDQWGRMYSYETIDTGFYHDLYNDTNNYNSVPTVFGGDIFINQFALKRKHAFFLDHTVSKPDGADIALDLLGNVGYPIYFYSTNQIDANFDTSAIDQHLSKIVDFSFGNVVRNIVSGGTTPVIAGMIIMASIFKGYIDVLGVPNVNLDCYIEKNLNIEGKAYLFSYGIPYFFTESEINVDYRQAIDDKAGDFYPHVGTDIPDFWLQESNVSILNDNSYVYNKSFSKQNKEIYFSHLREDYDPNKICNIEFPNRAIYSQRSNLEESKNNWLVYRPISYHDFPKNYGKLTALDGLESRTVLARFENKSQLYNVLSTIDTTTGTGYLGNPAMFSQPPMDFAETDLGYSGSQHKFLLKTELGHLSVDAERGGIFLLRGNKLEVLSDVGMSKWFSNNLPFNIKRYYPNVNIDNSFKDIGITGVYDMFYNRFIITKRDYIPLFTEIELIDNEFYYEGNKVEVTNEDYFCNKSWTISYSLDTNSWISFHSYIPNYYIGQTSNTFESGVRESGVWIHNDSIEFNKFYNKIEDYILEYPLSTFPNEEIISSFEDNTTVIKYKDANIYHEVDNAVYFNYANIYNNFQNTGLLKLTSKPINSLSSYRKYPKINTDNIEILYTKADSNFRFNTFWDITKDKNLPTFSLPCNVNSLDKQLDINNLDYSVRSFQKTRIRSKESKIRLIYNQSSDYKLISKFLLAETQKSYK